MNISEKELNIFSRQLILKEFSEKIFNVIQSKHIIIIGMGGIGCPLSQYLLACGIKKLSIFDNDKVELSNLNRQLLFSDQDIGRKKVFIAKKKLVKINSKAKIYAFANKIDEKNINKLFSKPSLIIDTTDNWYSMSLINKYCSKKSIPLLSTSVLGFDGQLILFNNQKNKHICLSCLYPNKNEPDLPRCETVGVIGTAAGITGLLAAQLAISFFLKNNNISNKLININCKTLEISKIKVKKNKDCLNLK